MNSAPLMPIEELLGLAIRHVNLGQAEQAHLLCVRALEHYPPHPALHQLLAVLAMQRKDPAQALQEAQRSLALRPDHAPTLQVAVDAALAYPGGAPAEAAPLLEAVLQTSPERHELWFQLSLLRQDVGDLSGAAQALERVQALAPERADAPLNLGIVLQDLGRLDEAMRAYARAYRLHEESFGRIAHALSTAPRGKLWLKLDDLRTELHYLAPP